MLRLSTAFDAANRSERFPELPMSARCSGGSALRVWPPYPDRLTPQCQADGAAVVEG
jgi:hypothetical protein